MIKMKTLLLTLLLSFLLPCVSLGQTTVGSILPHSTADGASKLYVALSESVQEVILESKPKGSKIWTAQKNTIKNLPGGTEVILDVPKNLRKLDLRVKVRSVRLVPQVVKSSIIKVGSELQVSSGLVEGTGVSAEYFDKKLKQWRRFATASAPKDQKKSWSIPVPLAQRAASLRVTRLDSKTPGSLSSRFPAAFRTGKTKFAGREISTTSSVDALVSSPGLNSASASNKASDSALAVDVQESDIWKVSGTKIYFFNQLRGLQVIETSNPADPEIISSLRMPAVGEDMYLLSTSRAVLVRRDWMNGGTTGVVLVDASGPQAKILSELQVSGWYVDSRLVGDSLVLVTSAWNSDSWQTTTRVSVVENLNSNPKISAEDSLAFSATAMGTGTDYLWLSGTKNWAWDKSTLALYPLADLPKLKKSLQMDLGGVIYDKFKIHQNGKNVFAVTQSWGPNWRQSTAIESYSLADDAFLLKQRLPLVEGESLHATRFDGDRAYIVTFEQIDPLWIVNLSDPAAMRIESELQVPGWSTFIQPVGGFLAAIGVEDGKVTASLFDVRDPANPSLSSRVQVGDGYSWSEANWNEKAVAILPESGLILLPYSSFDSEGHISAVQLVDMNPATGSLVKRGLVKHAFTPRRASALREGILASLSNRELFLLDASNRDQPVMLSDTALAFGTDRILGSREGRLVHAESSDWNGSAAVLRVSSLDDPDAVLSQASLGEGEILAAELRGKNIVAILRSRKNMDEARLVRFDASSLPELLETGRVDFKLTAGWNTKVDLLWPSEDVAVAAVRGNTMSWWRGPWDDIVIRPMASARKSMVADIAIWPPRRFGDESVSLQAFDLSSSIPKTASTLDLASIKPRNVSAFFAVDGLVVFSSDQTIDASPSSGKAVASFRAMEHTQLRIVDFANPAKPYLWPAASLPGRLESIAEFDRSAGLLFTSNAGGALEALFYEAGQANALTTLPGSMPLRAFSGRSVWTFSEGSLSKHRLSDQALFVSEGIRKDLPFAPSALRAHADGLLAQGGRELCNVPSDFKAVIKTHTIPGWGWWAPFDLQKVFVGGGILAAPTGEYGIEILK